MILNNLDVRKSSKFIKNKIRNSIEGKGNNRGSIGPGNDNIRRRTKFDLNSKDKVIYTYVLKDIELDIFKIGKTTNPHNRFRDLCSIGKIVPIALYAKDIEIQLHKLYKENRVTHKDFMYNGGTEWFKRGGKIDEFLDVIDTGKTIPFISLHNLAVNLIKNGIIIIYDESDKFTISISRFVYYRIGIEVLYMMGYVGKGMVPYDKYKKDMFSSNGKLAVSESLLKDIKRRAIFYVVNKKGLINYKGKKFTFKKIEIFEDEKIKLEVYLVLNKVL